MKLFSFVKVRRLRTRKRSHRAELRKYSELTRKLVHERLTYWNQFYDFKYNRVAIRAQRTRWGSCSSKGNLNFNYKLALLSPELLDYVIVHELCHLGEFNHSDKFWELVSKALPNYREYKDELRRVRML